MRKHFPRALALLLTLAMLLSLLPVSVFAANVNPGDGAAFFEGMPGDGSYGVIYSCGEDYSCVMGYDITNGDAAVLPVELTGDKLAIQSLPEGTAVFKFVKLAEEGTYYLTLGGKYLVLKDIDSNNKEKLVLSDSAEKGAKWIVMPDQAGMQGAYNIKNAEYKWGGYGDVYLEQYNNQKFCGYSYNANTAKFFQFKFAETGADDDGRIGSKNPGDPLPENGNTVVIYNDFAKGVFGQPAVGAAKDNLTAAPAVRTDSQGNHSIAYDDIGDGGLIFNVEIKQENGTDYYMFKTGNRYLGMSVNKNIGTEEKPSWASEESMILIPESELDNQDDQGVAVREYCKWDMTEIDGGWLMHNKTAVYKGHPVYVEYFDDLFCGYSYDSSRAFIFAMNFYPITDQYHCGYVVNPYVTVAPDIYPAIGTDCLVKFTVTDLNEITGTVAKYWLDGKGSQAKTAEVTYNNKTGEFTVPAADLAGHATLTLEITVTDAMDLTFQGSTTLEIRDEPLILTAAPAPNSATGEVTRPEISVTFANAGTNPTVTMSLDGETVAPEVSGEAARYTPAQDLETGKHAVSVTITRADGKSVTKNWSFFIGEGGEALYFGQVHSHTAEYSDGAGTLEQAYEHAYEVADLDFLVVTDHSNYFDTTATATTSSYYNLESLTKTSDNTTKWEEARATAKAYNDRWDDFVCLYGYEMTWSGGPGHTNTFNTYGVVSRNNSSLNDKTTYAGMHLYNDLMVNADVGLDVDGKEAKTTRDGAEVTGVNATKYIPYDENGEAVPVVSQFNHPGTTFGNFDNYAGYTAKRDSVLNLIEVGNGEGKVGGSSYFPSYEEYDQCLSKGWHVAPTNNQDNHKGNWGDSNTCRDVILTDDFSEIGIYRALDARRVYATEDQNLEIYYELEAAGVTYKLGDIANLDEDNQPETVKIRLTVNDPDAGDTIGKIRVIGEGSNTQYEIDVPNNSWSGEFEIPNDQGYYYIKVVEGDGDIAVTAPVWTKEAVPVSASVKTSAAVAAQGVEETIEATLTNASQSDALTLQSWKVTAEGRVIAEESELEETVAAGADKKLEIPFTPSTTDPSETKTYQVQVEFTFSYKGKSQSITQSLTETSYPPELMTYIGLDRGHTNFYVSGDYAGNEGSFIKICADNGIICEYINAGEMTKENLAKYKLVVLTVPRVNESTAPTVWTEEELEALADYAANGGNIINLSKSDRYDYFTMGEDGKDTYENASATISNLVNEAVGAKTRFVRGIVVDNEKKSNEAYRINFNGADLLGEHPFTQAIYASSNGQYQYYNGTGLTIEEGADVTTLVAPYPTTWIASYKDNFTGSAYKPDYEADTVMARKGEFALVTCEELSGGGFLVCGGACFISNYDLKAGTPAAQQYENYGLVLNILEYVKNGEETETISPIADVHKGEENQEFTIEGTVTTNASDFDKDTAFFDCIYVQDDTRGINCFPVSGYYYIGEQVRVHGAVTYYCGEIELNLKPEFNGSIKVISNEIRPLAPAKVTCKEAMSDDNIGNLMQISGVVADVHRTEGVVDYIYVDDGSGELGTFFINNYIQQSYEGLDSVEPGMRVEGIGIGSRDVNENSGGADGAVGTDDPSQYIKRLRVRSRAEIKVYEDPCARFTDVDRGAWYHEGVDYVLENGIMNGTGATTFAPNVTLTRSQITTILYRLDGAPPVTEDNPFQDVPEGTWYTDGVIWASSHNITNGTGDGNFNPDGEVTREQLVTFLYRYLIYKEYDVSGQDDLASFEDRDSVSNWALTAMQWAVSMGIVNGAVSDGKVLLAPQMITNRGMIATILYRLSKQNLENQNDLVILYTNDVHCGIDSGDDCFGYGGLAALKADMLTKHRYVGLVDAGDFVQGEAIGSLSKGANIITLMNEVGYDAVTLGNHEFDYGVDNIRALVNQAEFPVVTANWVYTGPEGAADAVDLDAYTIVEYGDVKVAYVGITTPESLVKSTPTYFQDAEGNWIYDFCNDKSGEKLYTAVQTAVNAARAEGADYVIALAHLGTDSSSAPWRSIDVIRKTVGIDVVLDGHSHSVIPSQVVKNLDGNDVLLSSTGTKLANVGKLTITADGQLRTELISRESFPDTDQGVENTIRDIEAEYEELLNTVVLESLPIELTVNNPNRIDAEGKPIRAVRYQETNLGDVCADAYRYAADSDIAFVNGGGVRQSIKAGDVTYDNIIKVHPFGNELVVVKASGQQILDALEMASRDVSIDESGNLNGENGGFLQVSGLRYAIYTGTPSTVERDDAGMFAGVTGARRVGDVEVLNKETGVYEPIDPEKTYTLASHNYMLKEGGDGLNMFMKCEILQDGGKLDYEVLINYMQSDLFATRLEEGLYNNWDGDCARINVSPEKAEANLTELLAAIEAAEALNQEDYNEPTWAALTEALNAAKALAAQARPSQEDVDAAAAALRAAIDALRPAGYVTPIYTLADAVQDGDQVVIYNPGYGKAVKNENDNHWYLTAADAAPENNQFVEPEESLVWTVHVDDDGCYSFTSGDNAITGWHSTSNGKDYLELTNDPKHAGAETLWQMKPANADTKLYYIYSKNLSNSYGPGYIECYTKNGQVKVCGYYASDSKLTEKEYGFQFYVLNP